MNFSEHKLKFGEIIEFEDGFKVLVVEAKEVIDEDFYDAAIVNLVEFNISDYFPSIEDIIPYLEAHSEAPIVKIYTDKFN